MSILRRRVERLEAAFAERGGMVDWDGEAAAYGALIGERGGGQRTYVEQRDDTGCVTVLGGAQVLRYEIAGVDLALLR